MRRGQDIVIAVVIAVVAVFVGVMIAESEWRSAGLGAGFLLSMLGSAGMYFRLKRELPDHSLARASYWGGEWTGAHNRWLALIQLRWRRHGLDIWTGLFAAGILMMAAFFWTAV